MNSVEFHWIRHGPTHCKGLYGWTDVDVDLSDLGTIEWLQQTLPDDAMVVSSDLRRARRTADAIIGKRGRLPDAKELREFNFGDWEGKTHDEIHEHNKALSEDFWNRPGSTRAPNGESWQCLQTRINRYVNVLTTNHPRGCFILVAHYGVILTQIQRALAVTSREVLGLGIQNYSCTKIILSGGAWKLDYCNRLPGRDSTEALGNRIPD